MSRQYVRDPSCRPTDLGLAVLLQSRSSTPVSLVRGFPVLLLGASSDGLNLLPILQIASLSAWPEREVGKPEAEPFRLKGGASGSGARIRFDRQSDD